MPEHITVVGNIANTPEPGTLPNGDPIARFRVASTTQHRQADGTWVDAHTSWYRVTAYRRLAEHTLASLGRGQRVIVTGRFRLRAWEANGKRGTDAEIDADALGPDLLFGTTTYRRDDRGRTAAPEPAEAQESWAEEEAPADPVGGVRGADGDSAPALVGAPVWDTRPLGAPADETPF